MLRSIRTVTKAWKSVFQRSCGLTKLSYGAPTMGRLSFWMYAISLWVAGVALGCNPEIGDDCTTSTDCSINGDRLCDTTQPGGYCTIFNCEPDTCPEEAQCVAFDTELDPTCQDQRWARFERTFCMLRCKGPGDCRSGYICSDMNAPNNPWGAHIADQHPDGTKVCIAFWSGATPGAELTEVCSPYDGGFPEADSVATSDASSGDSGAIDDAQDGSGDSEGDDL